MYGVSRAELVLRVCALLALAAALTMLVLPARAPQPDTVSIEFALPDSTTADLAHAPLFEPDTRLIATNMFSRSRAAPATRYDPAAYFAEPVRIAEFMTAEPTVDGDAAQTAVPQLFGIIMSQGGAAALLRLHRDRPDARLYRTGDSAAGFIVDRIEARTVVLRSVTGRIVLNLSPGEGDWP
jgi:hypothetical protein